jgi:hypothetical protein
VLLIQGHAPVRGGTDGLVDHQPPSSIHGTGASLQNLTAVERNYIVKLIAPDKTLASKNAYGRREDISGRKAWGLIDTSIFIGFDMAADDNGQPRLSLAELARMEMSRKKGTVPPSMVMEYLCQLAVRCKERGLPWWLKTLSVNLPN